MPQLTRETLELIVDRGPAGTALRRALPVALLLLVLWGGVAWGGHRMGLFGLPGAVALYAGVSVAVLVAASIWLANRVRAENMARQKAEVEVLQSGLHDPLTGLPTRGYFLEQLGRRLALAERRSSGPFAVFCLSLDGFEESSRGLDRQVAEAMMIRVADVIRDSVRATDLVARLGGEEFAILIEELAEPGDGNLLAQRLLLAVPEGVAEVTAAVEVKASIGIAFRPKHHIQAGDLLREAAAALQLARQSGAGRYPLPA
jgi:diguanylate cyclase (GGDEF)-like protein